MYIAREIWKFTLFSEHTLYTNFHKNLKFFEIFFRHIGSAILNIEKLTAYSKSATQKPSVYKFSWKLNNF